MVLGRNVIQQLEATQSASRTPNIHLYPISLIVPRIVIRWNNALERLVTPIERFNIVSYISHRIRKNHPSSPIVAESRCQQFTYRPSLGPAAVSLHASMAYQYPPCKRFLVVQYPDLDARSSTPRSRLLSVKPSIINRRNAISRRTTEREEADDG
jgi:hypothetical protein